MENKENLIGSILTANEIAIFVKANILNAIDANLIPEKYEDINFKVEEDGEKYKVTLTDKLTPEKIKNGMCAAVLAEATIPKTYTLEIDHLRYMMGATIKIFEQLAALHPTPKPTLHVVKGGLDG